MDSITVPSRMYKTFWEKLIAYLPLIRTDRTGNETLGGNGWTLLLYLHIHEVLGRTNRVFAFAKQTDRTGNEKIREDTERAR
jgi:hypothetical protein